MRFFKRALYRVRQFGNAFRGIKAQERALAEGLLNPQQKALFFSMNRLAQRHALDMCYSLIERGYPGGDILKAALLHDVGKGRVGPLSKALGVLLGAFSPKLLELLAAEQGVGWRRALHQDLHHPQLSAVLAEAAESSDFVVELIRHHQVKDAQDPIVLAFQAADNES